MALLEFYGEECPHCRKMESLVERLEEEEDVEFERFEVWHDEENAQKLRELDQDRCGGVPFFYNKETEEFICGETSYEDLKKWAGVA
ncbi:MAG: hypothetical protein MAG715_00458 [Methanonatronarchaeales archaeon]|nr:hypothetical protein [Methanonatronarchaeales archaeon]